MSTSTAPVQTAAPGTPGSEPTPLQATAKTMISDAFKSSPAPAEPAQAPAKPSAPAAPAKEAAPAAKSTAEPAKKPDAPATPPAATKPVAEPAPELPEDKLQIPANASPEAVKNFKAYKDSMKEILAAERKRVSEAEAKLKLRETAAPADTAELERLRSEHKALSDRLLTLDLQNHPDFHKQYIAPRQKAFAESETLLADNGITEKVDFNSLLAKPRAEFAKTVSELAAKMNSFDSQTFTANMRQAYQLRAEESQAIAKAGDVHQQLQAQSARQQKQAFESVANEAAQSFAKKEITDDMPADIRAATEKYNASVDTIRTRAEAKAFGKLSERDVAQMAFKDVAYDHMVEHVAPLLEARDRAQVALIADLTAKLEAVNASRSPNATGGDPKPNGGQPPTTRQMIAEAFKRGGG